MATHSESICTSTNKFVKVTFESSQCKNSIKIKIGKDRYRFRYNSDTLTGQTQADMVEHFKAFVCVDGNIFGDEKNEGPADELVVVIEALEIVCHCNEDAFGQEKRTRLTVASGDLKYDCDCWRFENLVSYVFKQFQ